MRFQSGKLQDWLQRFFTAQVPADSPGDLRKPSTESRRFLQLPEMLPSPQQRFDHDILRVGMVAAYPQHLPVYGVLMLIRQGFEVH